MTNKSSSGDNKMHQIIMAVITTIAAPVIVFLVTNNIKNSPPPEPTVIVQVITATLPASTATQAADAPAVVAGRSAALQTDTATVLPTVSPTVSPTVPPTIPPTPTLTKTIVQVGVTNPDEAIKAGTPVVVNSLVLTVNKQDVKIEDKIIRVTVHIRNASEERRTLTFSPASFSLKDNTGHTYAPFYGDKKSGCKKDDLSKLRNIVIEPKSEITLSSVSSEKAAGWCAEKPGGAIPFFSGPVGKNAKQLELQINRVEPFQGIQINIGL